MYEFLPNTLNKSDYEHGKYIKVDVSGVAVWLKITDGGSIAFYDECGHMGGSLKHSGSSNFVCKVHGWTYDLDGKNLNEGSPGLRKVKIVSEDAYTIVLLLPVKQARKQSDLIKDLIIKVHSHACLTLQYSETKLLFDPWLFGSAYYGSWHLQPDPVFNQTDIKPTGIIITHPHPDHFHLDTLRRLDPNIPIYFPNFPSRLIEKGLSELNWKNINPVGWGEITRICENLSFEFLRPRSMWEDAAVLTTLEDDGVVFQWLNLVDAGSVIDEFSLPDLDLLSSAFDQGASGYPLTWNHLDQVRKVRILEEQKKQTLKLLPARSKRLKAKYFLPFAGHWRLGLSEHKEYADSIPHTSFSEIIQSFALEAENTEVLALKPGLQFNFFNKNTSELQMSESPSGQLKEFDKIDFSVDKFRISSLIENFEKRMSLLQKSAFAFNVEPINFEVNVPEIDYKGKFNFPCPVSTSEDIISISVEITAYIFKLFADGRANWDHIAIGYWGKWNRSPNVYPANFMRLLQSGDTTEYAVVGTMISASEGELLKSTVGDLIEKNPKAVGMVLNRAGLPCVTCTHSNAEKLSDALAIHNVDLDANPWIIKELMAINLVS